MIDRKLAAEQVKRLHWLLPANAVNRDAIRELVDALENHSETAVHAERVVDSILEGFDRCPMPRDIRRIAFELRPPSPSVFCGACGGSGWLTKEMNGYSGAVECTCRKKEAVCQAQ